MTIRTLGFRFLLFAVALLAFAVAPAHASATWYVTPTGAGTQNGTSWANAFPTIEQAIAATSATPGDQIFVKEGVYYPPVTGGGSTGYIITRSIKLYGGFKGTEASVQGRLGSFRRTILDGNINNPTLYTDNALHVVNITDAPAPGVVIDGFLIRNGYATGAGINGAGILSTRSNLNVANCYLENNFAAPGTNYGGGIFFTSAPATGGTWPVPSYTLNIKKAEFTNDHGEQGGAIYAEGVTGSIVNTKFVDGLSTGSGGAVLLTHMSSTNDLVQFANCVFYSNLASGGGTTLAGGLYLGDGVTGGNGYAALVNCTFADNKCNTSPAPAGQAMALSTYSTATVDNSIFFYNNSNGLGNNPPIVGAVTATYSDIEGSWSGSGNINSDPLYVNLPGGDLSLYLGTPTTSSPCIDAADYGKLPLDILDVNGNGNTSEVLPWDYAWLGRTFDQTSITDTGTGTYHYLDMGAYERH